MNYFIITALHVYTVHVNAVKKLAFGVNQCKVNSISRMQFLTWARTILLQLGKTIEEY